MILAGVRKDHMDSVDVASMTLIVGIRAVDGIVLASDSRGTFGDPRGATAQNDSMKKLYVLRDRVAMGMAGAGEIGAALLTEIHAATKASDSATSAMHAVNKTLRQKYAEMFPNFQIQPVQGVPYPARPTLQVTICGYDQDGQARIFSLNSTLDFAPHLHDYGFSVLGVPTLAVYLLNRLYRPDTKLSEAIALAAYTISETAAQDGKVGGPIQMVTMAAGKSCVELKKEEVDSIVRENEDRATRLRELFFQRKSGP
jgi:20S proteasome alpha/beta subunit